VRSFAVFLALIIAAMAAIAALAYPAWMFTQSLGLDFKFPRVAARVAMLVLIVGFVLIARRLRVADRASLGWNLPARQFLVEMTRAWLFGVMLMAPVLATMFTLDMRVMKPEYLLHANLWAPEILTGVLAGLLVGVTEETFMRGAMQTAITRESGTAVAIALTAPLYAATHFFAKFRIAAADVNPGSGLDMLTTTLASFVHPLGILDAFVCLTLVGVLLGMVRALTGNIAACVGLHAAWVAVIFVVREVSSRNRASPAAWLMGDYDGFVGWMVLAWMLVIGWVIWWYYGGVRRGKSAQPGSPRATA
jgi:membrane protease YdiL (CAAX protease family)